MVEPVQDPASLPIGGTFHGRYEIVRRIQAGGMGAVYEVRDIRTRRRRALKVMLPEGFADAALRSRFKLEATVAAEVDSEHLVETSDAGIDPDTGIPFLVMELLKGEDLRTILDLRGRLPGDEVVNLLSQTAVAIDKMHAAGVLHRDLKPGNLFVSRREDGSARVKVLDFGIAKLMAEGQRSMQTTGIVGTPLYMSPEQLKADGTTGTRSDLYALAHLGYTLLVGKAYWEEDFAKGDELLSVLLKISKGALESGTLRASRQGVTLPPAFDAWFARATAVDPAHRFDRALTLVLRLAESLGVPTAGVSALSDASSPEVVPSSPRPRASVPGAVEAPATLAAPSAATLLQATPAGPPEGAMTVSATSQEASRVTWNRRGAAFAAATLVLGALGLVLWWASSSVPAEGASVAAGAVAPVVVAAAAPPAALAAAPKGLEPVVVPQNDLSASAPQPRAAEGGRATPSPPAGRTSPAPRATASPPPRSSTTPAVAPPKEPTRGEAPSPLDTLPHDRK